MGKFKFTPKYMIIGLLIAIVMDGLFVLFGSVLIEENVLGLDCAIIWTVVSLIAASGVSSWFLAFVSGVTGHGYLLVGLCVLFMVFLPMAMLGTRITVTAVVKSITALFCGALVGNYLGMTMYHSAQKKRTRNYIRSR